MKVAIIGRGFAGLALCFHLLDKEKIKVTVFGDSQDSASNIASGLLHPYAGEQVRRSWRASEALKATSQLLETVQKHSGKILADFSGIERLTHKEAQEIAMLSHAETYKDVIRLDMGRFLITSGITVFSQQYLEELFKVCVYKGALFESKKITSIDHELSHFDLIVIAAGAGCLLFKSLFKGDLSLIKGQQLTCLLPKHLPALKRSLLAKAHIAKGICPDFFHLGSTYERIFSSEDPCMQEAKEDLFPKAALIDPLFALCEVQECRSAFRVVRRGHYLPIIGKVQEKTWIFTALGSRGLLYHSYLAELLARAILKKDESIIPRELQPSSLPKNKAMS